MQIPADTKQRPGYVLEFEDEFDGTELDRSKWSPYMLPHWTTAAAAAASYRVGDGRIELRIEEHHPLWRPGENRVSNIETGHYAGPLGSQVGQFRWSPTGS